MIALNEPVKKIIAIGFAVAWVFAARAQDTNSPPAANVVTVTNFVTITNIVTITNSVVAATNPPTAANLIVVPGAVPVAASSVPAPIKKPAWDSSIAAGLTVTRGNSDTLLFTAKFQTQKKLPLNEWIYEADAAYGENASVLSEEILHGNAQYNHLYNEQLYGYASADALHDGIQDLAYQVTLSPGAGYHFVKTLATDVVGEIGPGVITQRRGDEDDTYLTMRLAEHWNQKLSPNSKAWEKVEFLPDMTKFANYIMNAEVGMESAFTKNLSLQVTLDDSFVNEPAAGRGNNDIRLVSGIVYKF